VYEYNQLGLLSTGTTYVWNNSGWENSVLWTSTYNSNSEIIQEVFQTWDGTTWENAERTVYEYFPNSIIITFDISLFGAWINLLRLVANNDSNGHPYEIKIQIWLFGWENLNRSLLTYDNNYNEIQNLNQDWDFDISDWVNSTLITSTYTSENLLNDVLTESWSANSYWINSSFKTYNYDQHLNRIETIKQSWNGNNWSNSEREVFEYLEVTSVEEPAISPKEYKLIGNYPNPFNPTTTIKFYVPELSNVTLNVYNAIGEKVAVLLSTELATGTYELKWNSVGLPSGIYFCQLKTEGFVETKKMILLK